MTNKPRIFILYTGGTIGMKNSPKGLIPDTRLPEKANHYFQHHIQCDWHSIHPLIDSAAITLEHWQNWLDLIKQKINNYDGILILHGTDTLAYTASLFAHAITGLNKPIIFCGSQKPIDTPHSDAPSNLQASAALFHSQHTGVSIVSDTQLLDAHNSSKINTENSPIFHSRNHPPQGQWDGQHWSIFRQPEQSSQALTIHPIARHAKIISIHLTPGYTIHAIAPLLNKQHSDALILLSYGNGNAPDSPQFLQTAQHFIQQGGIIINASQVTTGNASARYAQNHPLTQAGIINAHNWGIEAINAKLLLALAKPHNHDRIKTLFND